MEADAEGYPIAIEDVGTFIQEFDAGASDIPIDSFFHPREFQELPLD